MVNMLNPLIKKLNEKISNPFKDILYTSVPLTAKAPIKISEPNLETINEINENKNI